MKIYDISQEVFSSCVYPGDPAPKREVLCDMRKGDVCNLTAFSMCAHNGTHIDAPYHFIPEGKTVEELSLSQTVGYAYVYNCTGEIDGTEAQKILKKAKEADERSAKRILIKGDAVVTVEAARVFADEGVKLVGNESQTVGPEAAPAEVHKTLLGAGTVLLEGIRLSLVEEGAYFLFAAPLCLSSSDGAPCRAVLVEF